MSASGLPPTLGEVVGPLREAARYERVEVARRRGLHNVLFGIGYLSFLGFAFPQDPNGPLLRFFAGPVIGLALAIVSVGGILRLRKKSAGRRPEVFGPEPGRPRFPRTMGQAVVLSLAMLALLLPYMWVSVAHPSWFGRSLGESLAFAAGMVAVGALHFSLGLGIHDRALKALSLVPLAGSLLPLWPGLEPNLFLWWGLLAGAPLCVLGLFRLVAPRGWLGR